MAIPEDGMSYLCDMCSTLNIADYFQREKHVQYSRSGFVGPTNEAVKLGTFRRILAASQRCGLCRAIVQAMCNRRSWLTRTPEQILAQSRSATGKEIECWIFSYAYARSGQGASCRGNAFRIGIGTYIPDTVVFSMISQAGEIQLLAQDAGKVGAEGLFHGRRIKPLFDLSIARDWLHRCEKEHGPLCSNGGDEDINERPSKMLVIDVQQHCLRDCPPHGRYVTLSYCWPRSTKLTTTTANVAELRQPDALKDRLHLLPWTIRDAITCAQCMGEKYLWIDALCIIQDSEDHKKSQIYQMDKIYTGSSLTLVAAYKVPAGQDEPCSGLPGLRPNSRNVHQHVQTAGDLTLAVPLDTLSNILEQTRWDYRAWTFQERMMSRRSLYFTDAQVYFQCTCAVFCEDSVGEGADLAAKIYPGSNLWNGISQQTMNDSNSLASHMSRRPYATSGAAISAIQILSADYSGRSMSDPSDIFHAFHGVQNVLEVSVGTRFWYGVPELYLDWGILWTLREKRVRRQAKINVGSRVIQAPSWSWAGWQARSEHGSYFYVSNVRSEVPWFMVSHFGRVLYLDVSSFREDVRFTGRNRRVRPMKTPPKEILEASVLRNAVDLESEEWRYPRYLACQTAVTSFKLVISETVALGDHGKIWQGVALNMAILDRKDRWAGSIMLDRTWIAENIAGMRDFQFMLLSRSERMIELVGEPAYFDRMQFEERDWCLLNVMMADIRGDVAERLGVGFIHEDSWVDGEPRECFIKLE